LPLLSRPNLLLLLLLLRRRLLLLHRLRLSRLLHCSCSRSPFRAR
jgi:hypothetical protein